MAEGNERQRTSSNSGSKTAATNNNGCGATTVVMPTALGSPTASEMKRRRRHSRRLMSNTSSVVSAAAAGIPSADKHKISNNEALLHMVKATIGGGFLAMPDAFHNVGVLVGCVGTLIIGLAVLNMMATIVRCSQSLRSGKYAAAMLAEQHNDDQNAGDARKRDHRGKHSAGQKLSRELLLPPMDYPDTVEAVFVRGARGRFAHLASFAKNFTSASLVTTYYGVNIIYVCIVAGTFKQLVDQYTTEGAENSWTNSIHGLSIRWYPALTAILIIPVGMVRLIKYLVPFSIAANTCLVAGACAVFYFIFSSNDGQETLQPEEQAKLIVWPITQWSLFMGTTLCSLEGVGMLLHIENAMLRPLELAGPPAYTLHKSMLLILVLNGSLGLFGYLRYGSRVTGSISLNLPSGNKLSEAIKVLIALGILLTYGLQLTVTTDLAWQGLRSKFIKSPAHLEKSSEDDDDSLKITLYYYSMRFMLILGTILVATALPDIGPLVSLVGSVGFSILGLIVPICLEIVWYWYPTEDEIDDECWDATSATENGNGAGAMASVDGEAPKPETVRVGCETWPAGAAGGNEKTVSRSWTTTVWRVARHVKNFLFFLLAIISLAGGTYFNIREMMTLTTDFDTQSGPVAI